MEDGYRTERDSIGEVRLPSESLGGVHTSRAAENFPLSHRPVHPELVKAYGAVKLACVRTAASLGAWSGDPEKADAIEKACAEMAEGLLTWHVTADALQGGAGTSANMNVNEVIANRALQLLGEPPGKYERVSPIGDINLYQSTNDTFPTALRLASIRLLNRLEERVVALLESFQGLEKKFAHVVKVGRTQYQDAVLTTLGREMGAYADALARDRWRIYKCVERLRVVNLGGTAIGTGITAPRSYVFGAVEKLRDVTGISFARAENLIDATQNADVFVEVSGIAKALAATLLKICSVLRLMSSGPEAGLGEIRLPTRQAGSSVMPGKVNPVIPEAVSQCAMLAMGYDSVIAAACAAGSLELNPFLPLVAFCLLDTFDLLANGCDILRRHCVDGIEANERRCAEHVENSAAAATALIPEIGYDEAARIAERAAREGKSVREIVVTEGLMTEEVFRRLVSPEAVCRLGMPDPPRERQDGD